MFSSDSGKKIWAPARAAELSMRQSIADLYLSVVHGLYLKSTSNGCGVAQVLRSPTVKYCTIFRIRFLSCFVCID
jgi:hypothetical protein